MSKPVKRGRGMDRDGGRRNVGDRGGIDDGEKNRSRSGGQLVIGQSPGKEMALVSLLL